MVRADLLTGGNSQQGAGLDLEKKNTRKEENTRGTKSCSSGGKKGQREKQKNLGI